MCENTKKKKVQGEGRMMKKTLKSNAGFSLVELMVVVAIIGILATLAVPQVNKFMAKARQAESKTNLSGIYTAQKAFFAEYNGYATAFGVIGYGPEGVLRYNTGFSAAMATLPPAYVATAPTGYRVGINTRAFCGDHANATGNDTTLSPDCRVIPEGQQTIPATAVISNPTTNAAQTFIAASISQIVKGSPNLDTWQINQAKIINNTVNGID